MSPVEKALAALGSPADVLERHGVTVRRRMALCPFHEDRIPSLSLFTGKDGRERWKCWSGCGHGDSLDLEARLSGRSVRELLR
ncbi:MAG: CHC2 zinc finger domain-containing protein [Actinomycetota bacterium]